MLARVFVHGSRVGRAEAGFMHTAFNRADAVYKAIESGYRLLDSACDYGNEKETGEGIKKAIDAKIVERKDLFVVSKLWNTFHRPEYVKLAC